MSNYLTRAAARAAPDTSPAVRPRLHSRYEGPASPAPFAAEQEMESPVRGGDFRSPGPIEHHHHYTAAPPADFPLAAPLTIPQPVLHESHHHTSVIQHQHEAPDASASRTIPAAPQGSVVLTAAPLLIAPGMPAPAASATGYRSSALESMPTAPPAAAGPATPALLQTTAPTGLPLQEKPAPAPPRHWPPSTVTPPTPTAKTVTAPLLESPRGAAPLPAIAAAAAPEQRTVNITIGRLEVRAATPTPERPRPQAAAGRGPLALDDFLRGKSPRRTRLTDS